MRETQRGPPAVWFLFFLALSLTAFELQFATSSVGSVVSCPRLVHSSFLRNLSTTDGEKPYIAAIGFLRPRFEMPFGYFFGTPFCYSISPRLYLLIWKMGKQAFFMWGYMRDTCGKESAMGLDRLCGDESPGCV